MIYPYIIVEHLSIIFILIVKNFYTTFTEGNKPDICDEFCHITVNGYY
ncbi:hypothetical protein NLO413_0625 [Candidatus Neoehrlichia lotoris str. RAC413]|uniref:Uncharacterized protein n=1 Tax=Candidatus Neoehrlichia procyonis str. RAC413 TaxID=1359163 RepID=A0A0F3NMF5_9RICK|nr:hypothetical protein NLO413_0625 [Candidatus Neoehrlichia lotoris str. RAC413]